MRAIERIVLKIRGVNPDELERELAEMDEAKRRRVEERERAEAEARKRYVEMRMRRTGGKS